VIKPQKEKARMLIRALPQLEVADCHRTIPLSME